MAPAILWRKPVAEVAARTAWAEARGEGTAGLHAVLNVIHNRAANPGWWGDTVQTVCLKSMQFSCWNADDLNREAALRVTDEDPLYRAALSLATVMVRGELSDITKGADSYYAVTIDAPAWARGKTPTVQIGHHRFYHLGLKGDGK